MKRITLFAGHYGSGKTNLAINYALSLAAGGRRVVMADMDIVNPYFRTKDSEAELEAHGIRVLSSLYANTNLDAPAMPASFYGIFEDKTSYAVLDIGGDDRGASALGRYAASIREEGDYECIFVANAYRPLTRTPAEALAVLLEIEAAGGVPFTAIAGNSNLGEQTTADTVLGARAYTEELSRLSGLPVVLWAVRRDLVPALGGQMDLLFPLDLQKKYY